MLERVRRARARVADEPADSFPMRALRAALPYPNQYRLDLLRTEWAKGRTVPLAARNRLRMLRRGFTSPCYHLYGFDERPNYSAYVSEFQKMAYTGHVNGPRRELLDDKLAFHEAVRDRGFGDRLPTLYGVLRGGRAAVERAGVDAIDADRVLELLDGGRPLVLKAASGAGGDGVYVCRPREEGYDVNGTPVGAAEMRRLASSLGGHLVTECAEQAPYAAAVYPDAPNTVRALTMHPGDEPFLADAVHRFGVDRSGGVDNWSRGGLSASIDRATGALGPTTQFPYDGALRWFDAHPETGTGIAGRRVPGWDRIRDDLLEVADAFPDLPYVGWDLLVTAPGEFVLIEGNNQPDVDVHQVHGPLLADERIRDFYARFADPERIRSEHR